jgi:4-azaleucine resistance transporter AzlC
VQLTAAGVWQGMRRLFPVAVFVIPFGIGFGVAAVDAGMPLLQVIVMSMLVFSGIAQFAVLDFWPRPAALGSIALVALAVNARHVVMGAALAPWLSRLPPGRRVLTLALMTDTNFADTFARVRAGSRDAGPFLGGGLVLWLNWVAGTAIGAVGGAFVGEPAVFGFDVVMIAFLSAMVAGQLRGIGRGAVAPALAAAGVAVATTGLVPTGWNVILGAMAGGVAAMVFHDR